MKDGCTHLGHKLEQASDMNSGAVVAVTVQTMDGAIAPRMPVSLLARRPDWRFCLSENQRLVELHDAVTHGFRSSFRDYAAEQTHTPHAFMEAALAHTIKNKAEAAYASSHLFEKRRALMDSWAGNLAG